MNKIKSRFNFKNPAFLAAANVNTNPVDPTAFRYLSEWGLSYYNNIWYYAGDQDGYPRYKNGIGLNVLQFSVANSRWEFDAGGYLTYYSQGPAALPEQVGAWVTDTYGTNPVGTISTTSTHDVFAPRYLVGWSHAWDDVNGKYSYDSISEGRGRYIRAPNWAVIYGGPTFWYVNGPNESEFNAAASNVLYPELVTGWVGVNGGGTAGIITTINPEAPRYAVGFGTSYMNGAYAYFGQYDFRPLYKRAGGSNEVIRFDDSLNRWLMLNGDEDIMYRSTANVALPELATWEVVVGASPAGVVTT